MSWWCLYTRILKEDKSLEDGKAEVSKGFHRFPGYGKKHEPYGSMCGMHSSTHNSCEAPAILVLRPQFLGPGTQ